MRGRSATCLPRDRTIRPPRHSIAVAMPNAVTILSSCVKIDGNTGCAVPATLALPELLVTAIGWTTGSLKSRQGIVGPPNSTLPPSPKPNWRSQTQLELPAVLKNLCPDKARSQPHLPPRSRLTSGAMRFWIHGLTPMSTFAAFAAGLSRSQRQSRDSRVGGACAAHYFRFKRRRSVSERMILRSRFWRE